MIAESFWAQFDRQQVEVRVAVSSTIDPDVDGIPSAGVSSMLLPHLEDESIETQKGKQLNLRLLGQPTAAGVAGTKGLFCVLESQGR